MTLEGKRSWVSQPVPPRYLEWSGDGGAGQGGGVDEPRFAAYVAIDWGDSKHVWSLQPADSDRRERGEIEHSPEAVAAWAAMLSARFGGQPVALAVEQSRGPLVFMLGKYEQLHV